MLTRAELVAAYGKVNAAIDAALDELNTCGPLDQPIIRMKLRALVALRRRIRQRIATAE